MTISKWEYDLIMFILYKVKHKYEGWIVHYDVIMLYKIEYLTTFQLKRFLTLLSPPGPWARGGKEKSSRKNQKSQTWYGTFSAHGIHSH